MTDEELKPCPFCGEDPEAVSLSGQLAALCNSMDCAFCGTGALVPADRWNRRTLPPEVKALAEAVRVERHVRQCRISDENNLGARYGSAHLADAILAVDRALAAFAEALTETEDCDGQ